MYLYLLLLVSTVWSLGCASPDSKTSQSPIVKTELTAVSSASPKKWTVKKLGNQEDFATVQFVDQAHGWVVSRGGQIHLTSDGGETWQQKRVDIPEKAEVSASFFVNSLTGWVSLVRMSPDVLLSNETRSWLMKTEDGGNTWQAQYSHEALRLDRLYFVSDQEGWALGSLSVKRETLQDDPFLLHSADAGKHWDIVSQSLPTGGGGLEDAYYEKSVGLMVLNSEGLVFSSSDGGVRWQRIAAVPDEPSQTFFGRLGTVGDKRMWFLGGSSSYEGTDGVLAFRGPDDTWIKLKIHAYLNDLMFLTTDRVVACGFVNGTSGSQRGKQAVVLRSSDGGRTWVTDIPTDSSTSLTALARAGNHLWVVGEDGYIAMLQDF